MYPVCPHRNVPAAFQRFLGPDSGGMERFFPTERAQKLDDTIITWRTRGWRVAQTGTALAEFAVALMSVAGASVRTWVSALQPSWLGFLRNALH